MNLTDLLQNAELFVGLSPRDIARIEPLARPRAAGKGEVIFRLGEDADALFIVQEGQVELTLPFDVQGTVHEVRVQTMDTGQTLAWSALVPPFRLTMGARATIDAVVVALRREELLRLFHSDARLGLTITANLIKVVGARLNVTQALWIRELHRNVIQKYG